MTDAIPFSPFDVIIMSLVLEHIADLNRFFDKTFKLLKKSGRLLFSEIHPFRSKKGFLAHFKDMQGTEIRLSSKAHTEKDIKNSAYNAGFKIKFVTSIYGNSALADKNCKWARYIDVPMIQIWEFIKER